MIKIEELKELIKTILYTGYVSGEKPLSIMFVGSVGIGKSEILNKFKNTDNISFFTDITYMGLIQLLEKDKEVRHIIIPDFLKITMKSKSTTANITSAFNALMEEGLDTISMMGKTVNFNGKKVGIITATTSSSFAQHKKMWKSMGFLSRMLIISYDYKDTTIQEIFRFIQAREYLKTTSKEKLEMPIKNINVELSYKLAKQLRGNDTTFRGQKQLQTLAMALTLSDNRKNQIVTQKDIDKVNKFKDFINLNYTKL